MARYQNAKRTYGMTRHHANLGQHKSHRRHDRDRLASTDRQSLRAGIDRRCSLGRFACRLHQARTGIARVGEAVPSRLFVMQIAYRQVYIFGVYFSRIDTP